MNRIAFFMSKVKKMRNFSKIKKANQEKTTTRNQIKIKMNIRMIEIKATTIIIIRVFKEIHIRCQKMMRMRRMCLGRMTATIKTPLRMTEFK